MADLVHFGRVYADGNKRYVYELCFWAWVSFRTLTIFILDATDLLDV